jgi:hypothetical protein
MARGDRVTITDRESAECKHYELAVGSGSLLARAGVDQRLLAVAIDVDPRRELDDRYRLTITRSRRRQCGCGRRVSSEADGECCTSGEGEKQLLHGVDLPMSKRRRDLLPSLVVRFESAISVISCARTF